MRKSVQKSYDAIYMSGQRPRRTCCSLRASAAMHCVASSAAAANLRQQPFLSNRRPVTYNIHHNALKCHGSFLSLLWSLDCSVCTIQPRALCHQIPAMMYFMAQVLTLSNRLSQQFQLQHSLNQVHLAVCMSVLHRSYLCIALQPRSTC